MSVRVYRGAMLGAYGFPHGHPFGPDRLDAFWGECRRRGLDARVEVAQPRPCSAEELALFHTREYIDRVQQQSRTGEGYLDYGESADATSLSRGPADVQDARMPRRPGTAGSGLVPVGDTPAFPGVFEAASTVVGSVLDGARWILEAPGRQAFVPVAGLHHARRDTAAGFCVFNDIGVLIEWLRAKQDIQRIAYVDIDAHHGDGVFYSFEDDPDLIIADLHEDGRYLYPGTGDASETGRGAARDTKLNIPLEPGADDAVFLRHWPRLEAFVRAGRPEFLILQAGADSIGGDPITHLRLSPAAHGHAATRLKTLAAELCRGRLIALGGGGYNRANLGAAWCAVVEGLLGYGGDMKPFEPVRY